MATDPTRDAKFVIADLPDPCEDSGSLKVKADRCQRLAAGISDKQASDVLNKMALGYREAAERLAGNQGDK